MNTHHNFDRIASEWLSDGPSELSDRVLDAALDEVHLTRQRPAKRVPWRFPAMTSQLKLATAAAAVIVAAVGTAILVGATRGPSGVGGPGPTNSGPQASPCVIQTILKEPLGRQDCRYATSVFRPLLSMPGDVRWTPVIEGANTLQVNSNLPGAQPSHEGFALTRIDRVAAKPCQASGTMDDHSTVPLQPTGPGKAPAAFFAWLAQKTSLKVSSPTPTSIGGYQGLEATLTLPTGSVGACGGVVYFTWAGVAAGSDTGQQGVADGFSWRLAVIDVKGTPVLLEAWAPPERFSTFEPVAEQFLAGVRFE